MNLFWASKQKERNKFAALCMLVASLIYQNMSMYGEKEDVWVGGREREREREECWVAVDYSRLMSKQGGQQKVERCKKYFSIFSSSLLSSLAKALPS